MTQEVKIEGLTLLQLRDVVDRMLFDGVPPDAETGTVIANGAWDSQGSIAVRWPGELPARCRLCGCTDLRGCEGGCEWVEDPEHKGDLCSTCLPAAQRAFEAGSVPAEGVGKDAPTEEAALDAAARLVRQGVEVMGGRVEEVTGGC